MAQKAVRYEDKIMMYIFGKWYILVSARHSLATNGIFASIGRKYFFYGGIFK